MPPRKKITSQNSLKGAKRGSKDSGAFKPSMGLSPANLSKRNIPKQSSWCPKENIEFDSLCDADNPKAIGYKNIVRAVPIIKSKYPDQTPLMKSRNCEEFKMELYHKVESLHKTGSFNEKCAYFTLQALTPDQTRNGIITASIGNWGMSLAYWANKLLIGCTIVMPVKTPVHIAAKCKEYRADVALLGNDFAEAKREAFVMANEFGAMYINGYDNPSVIAGAGTIGLEILEQLPEADVILVPVGGGALIAGIAEAAKTVKPTIQIYGIEPDKSCCFFKAMENDEPYNTESKTTTAESLGIPMAGVNAFYTAKSLINKMVLVDDDWIARAVLHYLEIEKLIVEGAGATALSALLATPTVLPELAGKNVVCVVTGGNIDNFLLPRCIERARAIDGRLIKLTMTMNADSTKELLHLFSMIANVGCNVVNFYTQDAWILENDVHKVYWHIMCQARNLEHACSLRRVMKQLYPETCEVQEEPFAPVPICACYPKKRVL